MDRGDVYLADLNPTRGREQYGRRYVMVVTSRDYNKTTSPLICPLTSGGEYSRNNGFTVSLTGTGSISQGVVLCNQLRTVDIKERDSKFIERLPDYIVEEVLQKIRVLLE